MKYFGTDGFRGRANEGLNVEHAFKIGRFVGWHYGLAQERKARVESLCRQFAGLLEGRCLEYPYQWYNFFDFWLFQDKECSAGATDGQDGID